MCDLVSYAAEVRARDLIVRPPMQSEYDPNPFANPEFEGTAIDRRRRWLAGYARLGPVDRTAVVRQGSNEQMRQWWHQRLGEVLAKVTADAQVWLATRPVGNVVAIKARKRA